MNIFFKVRRGQKNENFCQGLGWTKKSTFFYKAGKKMKIFFKVRGGRKNEHFFTRRAKK